MVLSSEKIRCKRVAEAERKIANYRATILKVTRSKEEPETLLNKVPQDKERLQSTKEAFQKFTT